MKKSKIFFILSAIFVIITIGTFFYMNSREQICVDFQNEHPELTLETVRERIPKSEYEQVRRQYLSYDKANSNANTIFTISTGITVALLATGIVLVIVEKKKK